MPLDLAISPLSMKSTITFALLFCSSTVLAQLAPSIESDGDDIVLRASGGDVKFVTQTGGTTSLQELIDVIQKLKQQVAEGDNSTANVDTAMLEVSCTLLFFSFSFSFFCSSIRTRLCTTKTIRPNRKSRI